MGDGGQTSDGIGIDEAGAVLTVDLTAIRANYRLLRGRLGEAACAGVVKADGYGLGAVQVAQALRSEGCDRFFVAHLGEGIVLRKAIGEDAAVYILNGLPPGAEAACHAAGLIPVLNSLGQLRAWSAHAREQGRKLPAALQVDSGMSRLGLPPDAVEAAARELAGIELALVMSHLACADEPDHAANRAQLRAFDALRRVLPDAPASLANSSGIFLGADFHFDLARPGAALYGINPSPGRPNPMQPVVRLDARIVQSRTVPAGTGIGYGHRAIAETETRLATLSIGYADGWPRNALAGGFIDGWPLPVAGRVSMDSVILDASSLSKTPQAGAFVEMIGPHQSVDELAALSNTIGYEILTRLGRRFHRRYVGG